MIIILIQNNAKVARRKIREPTIPIMFASQPSRRSFNFNSDVGRIPISFFFPSFRVASEEKKSSVFFTFILTAGLKNLYPDQTVYNFLSLTSFFPIENSIVKDFFARKKS